MKFFNKTEIKEFKNISGKTYQPTNPEHIEIVKNIKSGIFEKTKHWAKCVTERSDDFTFSCKKYWSKRGWENGKRVSTFKPYTWAQIFLKSDHDKDIYFTIGINGVDGSLVYKLDYQYQGNKNLTEEQKSKCEKLIKSSPASWFQINHENIDNYNWEKLIQETIDFIEKHKKLYIDVVDQVWNMTEKRVARLTWNTNGWIMPSGPDGKSHSPESHECKFGYGHEEWLFDTSKIIDGYHYGLLEPIRKQQDFFSDNSYDIWLYTIDGITKKRYWVGEIKNLEVINNNHAAKIKLQYIKNNWLPEMEEQIKLSGANEKGFSDWKGVELFNVRFKPDNLIVNDPYYELPATNPIYKQPRYIFAKFKNEFNPENDFYKDTFVFSANANDHQNRNDDVETKIQVRKAKTVEIKYLHKTISNQLFCKLKKLYGKENVARENSAGYGGNRIDLVVKNKEKYFFYEIKTYNSIRTSIREAFGQLFEYSFWPDKEKAAELIIITQKHNEINSAIKYIKHLRALYKIPLYLQWFDVETGTLSEKY